MPALSPRNPTEPHNCRPLATGEHSTWAGIANGEFEAGGRDRGYAEEVDATVRDDDEVTGNDSVGEGGQDGKKKFGDLFVQASIQLPSGEGRFAKQGGRSDSDQLEKQAENWYRARRTVRTVQ